MFEDDTKMKKKTILVVTQTVESQETFERNAMISFIDTIWIITILVIFIKTHTQKQVNKRNWNNLAIFFHHCELYRDIYKVRSFRF